MQSSSSRGLIKSVSRGVATAMDNPGVSEVGSGVGIRILHIATDLASMNI